MKLNLTRPLVFFDIEATGLNISHDRIVELCLIKIYPDGSEESRTIRFNPTIPISAEASAVNGIKDEDVADCPTFKEKASEIYEVIKGCDIAGYNSNTYDVPLLVEEFLRAGIDFDVNSHRFIDVQTIYHKMEQRNLSAAYRFYCDKELTDAHTALADTRATYEVLLGQLERYGEALKNDVDYLAEFSRRGRNVDFAGRIVLNEKDVPTINFGKYKGQPLTDVLRREPGYYAWVMQGDFSQNTKQVFMRYMLQVQYPGK